MQKLILHRCSNCGQSFEMPTMPRPVDILITPKNHIPLEDFTHVACPSCGHTDLAVERKFFGFLGPRGIQLVVGAIVLGVIVAIVVSSF